MIFKSRTSTNPNLLSAPAARAPFRVPSWCERALYGTVLASLAVAAVRLLAGVAHPRLAPWLLLGFWLLASLLGTASLARRLPVQNVLMAALIIASLAAAAEMTSTRTGFPLGPYTYTEETGPRLLESVPLWVPLAWLALALHSRGLARLILRPWRLGRHYGLRLIALSALLAALLEALWIAYAVRVGDYYIWSTGDRLGSWQGVPWYHFVGFFATLLIIFAFALPWFINKQPTRQPLDYQPLIVWLGLSLYLAAANLHCHHTWLAAAALALAAIATALAIRGARQEF